MVKYYLSFALAVFGLVNVATAEEAVIVDKDGVAAADSDGNAVVVGNDGSVYAEDADGNSVHVDADGTTTIEDSDGNSVTVVDE